MIGQGRFNRFMGNLGFPKVPQTYGQPWKGDPMPPGPQGNQGVQQGKTWYQPDPDRMLGGKVLSSKLRRKVRAAKGAGVPVNVIEGAIASGTVDTVVQDYQNWLNYQQQLAAYETWRQEQLRGIAAQEGAISTYERDVLGWKIPKLRRAHLSPGSRTYLTRPQRIQYLRKVRAAESQRSLALSDVAKARRELAEERTRLGL